MASLKRDTPAGRAALARRRQRAAAVVENSSRFASSEEDAPAVGGSQASTSTQSSAISREHLHPYGQSHDISPPSQLHAISQQQLPQQPKVQRGSMKDPPPKSNSTAYSTPSDDLFKRSSIVAETAASVLAQSKQSDRTGLNSAELSSLKSDGREDEVYVASRHVEDQEVKTEKLQRSKASLPEPPSQVETRPKIKILDTPLPLHASRSGSSMSACEEQLQQPNIAPPNLCVDREGINEEECTIEEMEPVISIEIESEIVTEACILSGSWIMVKSNKTSETLALAQADDSPPGNIVAEGSGLGLPEELFQIIKMEDPEESQGSQAGQSNLPLRWGDCVTIVSHRLLDTLNIPQPRALGIRKLRRGKAANDSMNIQIGLFEAAETETWTIVRAPGILNRDVRLGISAVKEAQNLAKRRACRGERTHIVHSGDPLLMRHNQTGGLLSIAEDGSLYIVADSYDSSRISSLARLHSTSLLGQLRKHDRYIPRDADTFSFIKASNAPCPIWILGGGTSTSCNQSFNPKGHRIFLHQKYLADGNRHSDNPTIRQNLFGCDFLSSNKFERSHPGSMSVIDQENVLVDEVIGACLGLEGKYIRATAVAFDANDKTATVKVTTTESIVFVLTGDSIFDASLRNLVEKLLPLPNSYVHVSAFVATHSPGYEFGGVMQALCEALESIISEYAVFITALERQYRKPQAADKILTLRNLYAQLIPSMHSMSILERAVWAVRDKAGGALINALASLKAWSCEGDLVANQVLSDLLDRASVPYMTMLTTWLQHGLLRDPYSEFMIEICEKTSLPSQTMEHLGLNDESYTLRKDHILSELASSTVLLQKVLATGKYWRAVRACERVRSNKSNVENGVELWQAMASLHYSLSFSSISSFIQSMYLSASQALVTLLMDDFNLLGACRTVKQYFLLDQGDFLVNFLDAAEDELVKDLGDVSSGRVQHWLRMSVQATESMCQSTATSSRNHQPSGFAHRTLSPFSLRCRFQASSLIDHVDAQQLSKLGCDENGLAMPSRDAAGMSTTGLTGVESFVLDFPSVPFPISLVLSDRALGSYQLLFRLLFFAKYVERRLLSTWKDHQAMKELGSVRGLFGPTFLLRQRMLHFAQNLIYYIMNEVISPNWLELEKELEAPCTGKKRTVDDIVEMHNAFLVKTLEATLLTSRELVRTLTKLMTTCLMFADQMKLFTEATKIHDESSIIASERRKAIQRSLNDRGGGGFKAPVDKMVLREALNSFRQDRKTRLKKQKRRVGRELSSESYRRMVARFEEVFSAYLSEFMVQLNSDTGTLYDTQKTNLCNRLDYNGFLSSSIVINSSRTR